MNFSFMYIAWVWNTKWEDANERHTQMLVEEEGGDVKRKTGKWENKKLTYMKYHSNVMKDDKEIPLTWDRRGFTRKKKQLSMEYS
jgi:hypothetical protein